MSNDVKQQTGEIISNEKPRVDFDSDNGVFMYVQINRNFTTYKQDIKSIIVIVDNKEAIKERYEELREITDCSSIEIYEDGTVDGVGDNFISEAERLDIVTLIYMEDVIDMLKNKPELLSQLQIRRRRV